MACHQGSCSASPRAVGLQPGLEVPQNVHFHVSWWEMVPMVPSARASNPKPPTKLAQLRCGSRSALQRGLSCRFSTIALRSSQWADKEPIGKLGVSQHVHQTPKVANQNSRGRYDVTKGKSEKTKSKGPLIGSMKAPTPTLLIALELDNP